MEVIPIPEEPWPENILHVPVCPDCSAIMKQTSINEYFRYYHCLKCGYVAAIPIRPESFGFKA